VHWRGSVDVAGCGKVMASVGAASVSWMTLEPADDQTPSVVAALLHGHDAAAGGLRSSNGQTAIARSGDAWHIVHSESCDVVVPGAAGLGVWRVTLSGTVFDCGVVADDGRAEVVILDDAGHTDRYVFGERAAADEVADPVRHFQLTTLAAVGEACDAIGVPAGEVMHRLRRIRSSAAAGSATDDQLALLEPLTRICVRMNDLRLGES